MLGILGKKRRPKLKNRVNTHQADPVLLMMVLGLLIFGLVMITSIGVPKSIQLSAPNILYPNCSDANVDCYLLLKNHLLRLVIGLVIMWLVSKIPYRFWKKTASFWFIATLILLFIVLFIGSKYTTFARSWLVLFNTSVQPTEFAKLALIFYLATWMDRKREQIQSFQNGFLPFCVIAAVMILPIILQPDLGSTIVLVGIAAAMYFVAGANYKHFLLGAFVTLFVSLILVTSISHVQERFTSFLDSNSNCKQDFCWQSEQSKIAIGSGGFWGKGLTQGVQKSYWLPQATDDFIFAASAEELGFIRISILILAYAVIAYRGYLIARGANSRFVMLMSAGITSWVVIQAFVNLAVNLALMPVTGITLPFVSYGGSSLISSLIAVGILLQLSKHSDYAHHSGRRGNGGTYHSQYSPY
jgi:cell division protein FtsW